MHSEFTFAILMRLRIRPEAVGDALAIESVTLDAFAVAAHSNQREHLIVSELRESCDLTVSLVVELDSRIIGHVAVSPVCRSDRSKDRFGLGPLSAARLFQRRGTGSALGRDALRRLPEAGGAGCAVLGEPDYYRRFGFRAQDDLNLPEAPPGTFRPSHSVVPGPTAL